MNAEQAIAVLNDIYKGWSTWVPKNGSLAHEKLQALGTALAALREQAEREKVESECEYCDFSSGTIGANFDSADEFFLMETESGFMLCSDGPRAFRETKVANCPKCGKRLEGKQNG